MVDTLYEDDEHEYLVWKWRPGGAGAGGRAATMPEDRRVAVLGVGMHPWGKWGRNFVEYGVAARTRRAGRRRAGVDRRPVRVGCRHHPQRLPGLRGRRHLRPGPRVDRAAGWRRATRRARRGRPPSTRRAPRSSPGCATWPWSSGRTPRPRASSPRSAASAGTTPTGCASTCSAPPTPPTSPCTPAGAWSCTAPPSTTSPRSR